MVTFSPKAQIPQPVQPIIRPPNAPAANAPRLVNFGGGMLGTGQYGGQTLEALQARADELAGQDTGMLKGPTPSPFQGAAFVVNKIGDAIRERQVNAAESQQRQALVQLMSGIDPTKGPTSEQVAQGFGISTGLGQHLYDQEAALAHQERWDPIPTPPGETGQWFKNSVNGETKKVGGSSGTSSDSTMELRKEYNTQGPVRDYPVISNAVGRIEYGASTGNAAGDMALIFGYMKLLDPTSTVREGEYATVKNSGGIPDMVWNMYNKAKDGQLLNPDQRAQFVAQAQGQYNTWVSSLNEVNDRYSKIAKSTGVDPGLVLISPRELKVGKKEPDPNTPDPNKPPPDTAIPPRPQPPAGITDWPTEQEWKYLTPQARQDYIDAAKGAAAAGGNK